MDTNDSLKNDLLNLENKYWTAMLEHDLETALNLTDFPCMIAGENGPKLMDEPAFREMFMSMDDPIKSFEIKSAHARMLSPETAVIAYTVNSQLGDGEREAVDASTWIRRNGEWRCALHTETLSKS